MIEKDEKKDYGSSTRHLLNWMGACVCRAVLACIFLKPDARAAGLWLYEGAIPDMGIGLWPAVLLHAAMTVWCVRCLLNTGTGGV